MRHPALQRGASACSGPVQPCTLQVHHHQSRIRILTRSRCGDAPSPPSTRHMLDRRSVLGCVLAWSMAMPANHLAAMAEDGGADSGVDTSKQFVYEFASDVLPDLKAGEYYTIIVNTRRQCWADLAQCIASENYAKLALLPTQTPFADLRAAALYCPWALLQADDYTAAAECRKAYVDFDVHVQDLRQIAEAAAINGANPEQVQQSFILLNASLEKFLSSIPSRYF